MEVYMAVMLSVSCFMFPALILRLFYAIWWKPKTIERCLKEQGIYGPPYRLLYGNFKEIVEMAKEAAFKPTKFSHNLPRVDPFLQRTTLKYVPQVVVMEPALIKEILNDKFGEFGKTETNSFTKLFMTGFANIDGHIWAKHRKIINPAFHIKKLKRMLPAISTCCDDMIESWEKLVALEGSWELDVAHEFQKLTADVISRAAFGSSSKEGRRIFELNKEQGLLLSRFYYMAFFPWLRFLPIKSNARMREIYKEVQSLLEGILEKRKAAIKMGIDVHDDLLGLLLKSNNEGSKNNGMTTQDVIEECKLFHFAGQETTANLLSWTIIILSVHSDWQEKAREEVLKLVNKSKPSFDELSQLKIVTMILQEVLRLYPPTSLIRHTYKRAKLGEYFLPAGVRIVIPPHLVHRDPEIWGEDVMEFNPMRFSDGVSKASKDQISYFPFGRGPRNCTGQNFALLEAKMTLARMLQRFSFEISPSHTHAPGISITLAPLYGAQVILHKL